MHARKRGKAGSTKPSNPTKQSWVKYKPTELEQLVIKLAKQGNSTSVIGLILRDSYGVASIKELVGKSILDILKENKLLPEYPEDLKNLIARSIEVRKHMETNKKDNVSKRGLQLINSKILRLEKYYKRKGALGSNYNRKKAELSIRQNGNNWEKAKR